MIPAIPVAVVMLVAKAIVPAAVKGAAVVAVHKHPVVAFLIWLARK